MAEIDDAEIDDARSDRPVRPFLTGERVVLRPLTERDLAGPYLDWFNDPVVCKWNSHYVYPYTRRQAAAYLESLQESSALVLAIESIESRTHVGNVSLQDLDELSRTADFAIVIGDRDNWGSGVGSEAAAMIITHGFNALNLHRITAATFAENEGMRGLARHLGMREEGLRREALFKHGRHRDVIEFGVLASEWRERSSG